LTLIGLETFRGKPAPKTDSKKIGEDGQIEYNIVETKESFEIDGEQVNHFFLTDATADQVKKEGILEKIESKDYLVVELYKYKNPKTQAEYWYFKNPESKGTLD
jgi:hypothetical protein